MCLRIDVIRYEAYAKNMTLSVLRTYFHLPCGTNEMNDFISTKLSNEVRYR